MSEATQEFMSQDFRRIRADFAECKDCMVSLGGPTAGTDHVVAAQQLKRTRFASDIAALRSRVERGEKRMDLVDWT